MTRAIALVLAFLMVAEPCAATRIMVLEEHALDTTGDAPPNAHRMAKLVLSILTLGGVDYKVVQMRNAKTLFAQTGQQVWNFGTQGAYAEQFGAVVHINSVLGTTTGNGFTAYRMDSTLKTGSTKAATVPQLYLATNHNRMFSVDNSTLFADGNGVGACTTGVATGGIPGKGAYLATDPTIRWINSTYIEGFVANSTAPGGGWRPLVASGAQNFNNREPASVADDVCRWCDSTVTSATPETVFIFERPMNHITGASPVVFAMMAGSGLPSDSLYDGAFAPTLPMAEGEPGLALLALARLDSITGGGVFTKTRVPFRVALTIDGAFSYNDRMHPRGIFKADSSTFDASMDSLATLGIPVTFGVNLDSVSANAEWKRWLAKVPKARFSPQPWTGVDDTTATAYGLPSFLHPTVDIMGRYRRRAAFGDTTSSAGADSTIYKLLRGARFKCDSIWPGGRTSGLLMVPEDDWSPLGMTNAGTAPGVDSVLFAIARAGFSAVRVNSLDRDHDASYKISNIKGYYNRQGWYRDVRGNQIKVLGYPGYGLAGAVHNYAHSDSAVPLDSARVGMVYQELNRAWVGITQLSDQNYDSWPHDGIISSRTFDGTWLNQKDRVFPAHPRGSIIRMSANDFSGDPNRPTRRGWWVIKSLAMEFRAVNKLAGRTIIEFAYPEDITP